MKNPQVLKEMLAMFQAGTPVDLLKIRVQKNHDNKWSADIDEAFDTILRSQTVEGQTCVIHRFTDIHAAVSECDKRNAARVSDCRGTGGR